jgi:ABC-type branched-subunit amino acid transport system ATPase component
MKRAIALGMLSANYCGAFLRKSFGDFRVLNGGKSYFLGERNNRFASFSNRRNGIAYMPQKKNVVEDFTVKENLSVSLGNYPKKEAKKRVDKAFEILSNIEGYVNADAFHLSGGEKQLFAFGNALVHSPKFVLLDEPFANVDAENSEILSSCIADLKKHYI